MLTDITTRTAGASSRPLVRKGKTFQQCPQPIAPLPFSYRNPAGGRTLPATCGLGIQLRAPRSNVVLSNPSFTEHTPANPSADSHLFPSSLLAFTTLKCGNSETQGQGPFKSLARSSANAQYLDCCTLSNASQRKCLTKHLATCTVVATLTSNLFFSTSRPSPARSSW